MSADNEKIIDIQFDNAPQTIDIDFGNVQQITVGNVSVSLEETDEGVVITAWDAEGEETAFVRHGKDGYTPVKGVDYFDGKQGDPGYTPVKGVDYYTAADNAEMVSAVLASLPVYTGEVETV